MNHHKAPSKYFSFHINCEHWRAWSKTGVSLLNKIGILLLINRFQINYISSLLYPVSVSNFTSPERGVISTLIEDLTLKIAIFLLYPNKCSQMIENQHTISYFIQVSYHLSFFSSFFTEEMIVCTDTHFIHECSNEFILNRIYFKKRFILPPITNK